MTWCGFLGLVLVGLHFFYNYSTWPYLNSSIAISLLAIAGLYFYIAYSIKCPSCKKSWWWNAIKSPIGSGELKNISSQTTCPICGFTADAVI